MSELFDREVKIATLVYWAILALAGGFAGGGATAGAFLPMESVNRNERRIDDHETRMRTLESATTRIETQLESIDSKLDRLERALR